MSRRRLILGLLLLAVAGVIGVWVWGGLREREPQYGGKKLSEWVENVPVPRILLPPGPVPVRERQDPKLVRLMQAHEQDVRRYAREMEGFDEAIRHMGTNAIPYLVKWITYEPAPWKARLRETISNGLHLPAGSWVRRDRIASRFTGALAAFQALGAEGKAAIPEFLKVIRDPNRESSGQAALAVLQQLGDRGALDETLPALVACLTNRHYVVRTRVTVALDHLGTNARPALPNLVGLLHHSEPVVRQLATNAILKIDPEVLEKARAQ